MEKYKQNKINLGVLVRIQRLLQKFKKEELLDRRLAWIGILLLLALLFIAYYLFSSGSSLTISFWNLQDWPVRISPVNNPLNG